MKNDFLRKNYKQYYNYLKDQGVSHDFKTLLNYFNVNDNYSNINKHVMLDLSRGAVYKITYLKEIIVKLSMFGIKELWLYLEDTYKLDVCFFSYQRMGYSKDELIELDNFASLFNVELVFCIQTLGHMSNFLRWDNNRKYLDRSDILNVGNPETYDLIREILLFCKETFKSTKIHIGLDEAFGLGLGQYYLENKLISQEDLFLKHVIL